MNWLSNAMERIRPETRWYSLDFETKSKVDLLNEGLDNYVRCPEFDVIVIAARNIATGERQTASAYGDTPLTVYDVLAPILQDPTAQIIAHNAMFEYVVCCVMAERWGIPKPAGSPTTLPDREEQ